MQSAIQDVTGRLRYHVVRNSEPADARPEDPSLNRFSHAPMEVDDLLRYFEARSQNSYTRPEDPFPSRFSLTPEYSPNFGWPSTMMNAHDILVCLRFLLFLFQSLALFFSHSFFITNE